jgi:acid phosphatase type 7
VLAVGDIGDCDTGADDNLAGVMAEREGTVLALGDIAYPEGTSEDFAECFAPSWRTLLPRIRPVPGNHDYGTGDASAYFEFFGPAAGDPGRGYYSFDLGDWHLVALNSACDQPNIGCTEGSPQLEWLARDLSTNDTACTLAYWHVPRFSSGEHGGDAAVQAFWEILDESGADVILNAHDHNYERLAPMTPDGQRDDDNGIRQFVVGTGGSDLRGLGEVEPNNERWATGYAGFLELVLDERGYQWTFVSASGEVLDAGSDTCH